MSVLHIRLSESAFEKIHYGIRKSAHFVEYFILGALLWRTVSSLPSMAAKTAGQQFRLGLLLAALYAATDETHQIFVPTRQPAIHDVALDTCGAACGLAAAWAATRKPRPA